MRTRMVIGSIAALVIALGVGAAAQRPGGPGTAGQAGGPPPVVNQQGDPQQGQVGPGVPGGPGGQQGGMMMNGPNGRMTGMRGRGGQMPQNAQAGPMNGRGGRGGRGGGQNGPGMLGGLNLTPEQQASVARIHLDAADASATLAGQARELRAELHRATFADTKSAATLTDLTTKIVAIEKQLIEIQTKSGAEMAAVLTAEQRKKMRVSGGGMGPMAGRGRGVGRGGPGRE